MRRERHCVVKIGMDLMKRNIVIWGIRRMDWNWLLKEME